MNERVRGAWHQGGGGLGQTCLDTLFVFDTFPKFVIRKIRYDSLHFVTLRYNSLHFVTTRQKPLQNQRKKNLQ